MELQNKIGLCATLGSEATLCDAVAHALASKRDGITLPIDRNAHPHAFFREKDAQALPKEIRASRLNVAGLVDLATTLTGRPPQALLSEGLISACSQAIVDHFRLRAGEANAKGSSDHKIEQAYHQLLKEGVSPTPAKIRLRCGTRLDAIKRWFTEKGFPIPNQATTPPASPAPGTNNAARIEKHKDPTW